MRYRITVKETIVTTYEIDADNESAARQCAIDAVEGVDVVNTETIESELVALEPAA